MPIMDDPRVTLFFDTTHPLKSVDEPEVAVDSMYEPIYLPDGRGTIPASSDPGAQSLARLGPSPQQVPFPVLPTTPMPPIQYGQRLPAPGLPTGSSPVVPSFSQPMVQALQAPRYVSELPIQGSVQLPSYPAVAPPQGVSTVSPGAGPVQSPAVVNPSGILSWDSVYSPSGVSTVMPAPWQTQNPSAAAEASSIPWDEVYEPDGVPSSEVDSWYQDVPSAPGAPVTAYASAPPSGPDNRYSVVQMDDGSIAYAPVTTVKVNAPSTGEDNRYAPALAADGSTVMVATGYPLPAGVTVIPGVTNVDAEGFVQGSGQGMRPGGNLKNDVVLTPTVATPGLPGWVLPAAGIGLVLFLLWGRKKEEK